MSRRRKPPVSQIDEDKRREKTSMTSKDKANILAIVDALVEHGRERGVQGNIIITNTEAIKFAQELQRRAAARLPNAGLGMKVSAMMPVIVEEQEKLLDEFWASRSQN
jgi:hypothetical protein